MMFGVGRVGGIFGPYLVIGWLLDWTDGATRIVFIVIVVATTAAITGSAPASSSAALPPQWTFSASRNMYAMRYPYEYMPDEVRVQDAPPLTQAELKQFYQHNAVQVFELDEATLANDAS
jgi:hypothetical protein